MRIVFNFSKIQKVTKCIEEIWKNFENVSGDKYTFHQLMMTYGPKSLEILKTEMIKVDFSDLEK